MDDGLRAGATLVGLADQVTVRDGAVDKTTLSRLFVAVLRVLQCLSFVMVC